LSLTITHTDSDGIISAYLINKYVEKTKRVMFSNPMRIKDTIARSLIEEWEIERLYVLDISGNERALRVASIYDSVVWIDHHEWEPSNNYKNIEITIEREPSAARVVSKKYGIEDPVVDMADHLDQNSPINDIEKDFRDMISSIRNSHQRNKEYMLEKVVFEMIDNDVKTLIEKNRNSIDNFRLEIKRMEEEIKKNVIIKNINGKRLAIVETDRNIPVYKIQEMIDAEWDILVVIYSRLNPRYPYWKIELRSKELNILPIARLYGGGGHRLAAGANIFDNFELDELLRAFTMLYR
jgi:oligoribonuclease NrnB/cAMP/cGMP phosphodiesterase (DHH superfamily)